MQSSREVWNRLLNAGLVEGEEPKLEVKSPWYVKLLLSLSGWVGALFLVVFVGGVLGVMIGRNVDNFPLLLTLIGGGLIFFSYTMFKEKQSEFLEHFILALSVTGQGLVIGSMLIMLKSDFDTSIYLFIVIFQAFLMWVVPNYIHRMLSSFFMGLSLVYLFNTMHEPVLVDIVLTFSVAWLWMNEFNFSEQSKMEAIAYGQTTALVWMTYASMVVPLYHRGYKAPLFSDGALMLGLFSILLYVVWMILKESQKLEDRRVISLSAVALVVLAFFSMNVHSLVVGVILLLVGYAHSHRLLIGLGVLSSLASLSHYYYFREETLMEKAGLLLLLGVGLLVGRFVMRYALKKEEVQDV